MAKKKTEQVVEPVVEETNVEVVAEALPEITEETVTEVKEATPKKKSTTKKTTAKKTTVKKSTKKVEVPAEEVVAVDDKGKETPLTELAPETKGEIVEAEVPVEAPVEPVQEELIQEQPAEKPAKKTTAKKSTAKKPAAKKEAKTGAKSIKINELAWLYPSSVATTTHKTITGTVYLWSDEEVTGRYAVTNDPNGAGKLPKLCGWIDASYIK